MAWIEGSPDLESSALLLDELWSFATAGELVWTHEWRVGDLLFWDNRCTLHRRDPFPAEERRVMHRTQIKGEAPNGEVRWSWRRRRRRRRKKKEDDGGGGRGHGRGLRPRCCCSQRSRRSCSPENLVLLFFPSCAPALLLGRRQMKEVRAGFGERLRGGSK